MNDDVLPWLVMHAAMLINRFKKLRGDGKAAHEALFFRMCDAQNLQVAEGWFGLCNDQHTSVARRIAVTPTTRAARETIIYICIYIYIYIYHDTERRDTNKRQVKKGANRANKRTGEL